VLSGDKFRQITHDHTLVQSLVDDGRISPDEAATHPQRSLLLRALDGTSEAEPDLSIREACLGDRYLLCSDGLSGVVSEETLHRTLAAVDEPEDAVLQLVELAIRGGGPDNITCIVADVVDSSTAPSPPSHVSVMAGAASNGGRPAIRTDSPAARAHLLSQTAPQPPIVVDHEDPASRDAHDEDDTEPPRRRWPIVTSLFVLLVVVVIGGAYLGWRYTQDQYYVGTDGGNVAIFQGINQSVAGINLSHVHERTNIPLSRVPSPDSSTIQATVSASSLAAARTVVNNIRKDYQNCVDAYKAKSQYDAEQARYRTAVHDYVKRYGNDKVQRTAKGKIKATPPPKPTGTPPTIPAGCPAPSGTGSGSGS
jgi:protein phosphatase